jgi:hypothetical protein
MFAIIKTSSHTHICCVTSPTSCKEYLTAATVKDFPRFLQGVFDGNKNSLGIMG